MPKSAEAAGSVAALAVAVHDATLDDVPDVPAGPMAALAQAAQEANWHADHVRWTPPIASPRVRVRNDPIARDLVLDLHRRARRRVWVLDSLKRRLGVA